MHDEFAVCFQRFIKDSCTYPHAVIQFDHFLYVLRKFLVRQTNKNSETAMEKTSKNDEKRIGITPSTALLNRALGISPAPRMLTPYEIKLLRQSVQEVVQVVSVVLARKKEDEAVDGRLDSEAKPPRPH